MKRFLLSFLLIIVFAVPAFSSEVKNLKVKQQGARILFQFDLVGDDESSISVDLTMKDKHYGNKDLHLEGDLEKVKPGKGRKVYWNVLQDFPKGLAGEFDVKVTAAGGSREGMVFVKGGCFKMGDIFDGGDGDELPVHEVCVSDFYMDAKEATRKAFDEFTGKKSQYLLPCDDCAADRVSWHEAKAFCESLEKRLPTEAEWEYAARSGGKKELYSGGAPVDKFAWYKNNSGAVHPVGEKEPNGLGLYDMSGNVWEWVHDSYDGKYYRKSPRDNPQGPEDSNIKVLRGGAWYVGASSSRVANRNKDFDKNFINYKGVRCVSNP